MPKTEIDVDPCDHITSDAIGQPGQRVFYLQALQADKTYTVIIEKTQLQSLAVGIEQFLAEVARQNPNLEEASADYVEEQMRVSPPVDPAFRVGEIGLGYDQTRDRVVLFVREVQAEEEEAESGTVYRFWCSRTQLRQLARWGRKSSAGAGRPARSVDNPWSRAATSARRRTATCTDHPSSVTEPHQVSDLEEAFREGELELKGQFLLGSNYTFLVTVHYGGQDIPAVYKPSRGEKPLWDFPTIRWRSARLLRTW